MKQTSITQFVTPKEGNSSKIPARASSTPSLPQQSSEQKPLSFEQTASADNLVNESNDPTNDSNYPLNEARAEEVASSVIAEAILNLGSTTKNSNNSNENDILPPLMEVVDNIVQEDIDEFNDEDDNDEEDAFMDPIEQRPPENAPPPPPIPADDDDLDNRSIEERLDQALSEVGHLSVDNLASSIASGELPMPRDSEPQQQLQMPEPGTDLSAFVRRFRVNRLKIDLRTLLVN